MVRSHPGSLKLKGYFDPYTDMFIGVHIRRSKVRTDVPDMSVFPALKDGVEITARLVEARELLIAPSG